MKWVSAIPSVGAGSFAIGRLLQAAFGIFASNLRPLPLERIAAPTLIASVENDGYQTFAGARYTADRIPGARFIGYPRGGHLLVGHDGEFLAEVVKFLDERSPGVQ